MEKRCDIIEFGRPVDEPSSIVSNFLKPVKKVHPPAPLLLSETYLTDLYLYFTDTHTPSPSITTQFHHQSVFEMKIVM